MSEIDILFETENIIIETPSEHNPFNLIMLDFTPDIYKKIGDFVFNFFVNTKFTSKYHPVKVCVEILIHLKTKDIKHFAYGIEKSTSNPHIIVNHEDITSELLEIIKKFKKELKFIKAGLHAEKLKFGNRPEPQNQQMTIIDLLNEGQGKTEIDKKEDLASVEKYKLEIIGIDHSLAEKKALLAIQTLLHKTNYKGNYTGKKIVESNAFCFSGLLPVLKITLSEYLEAYGVTKKKTARGYEEFNSNERSEAIKALTSLHDNRVIINYRKFIGRDKKTGEDKFNLIRTVRPLIQITEGYQNLTREETETLPENKLSYLMIEPCVVLIDQIETHFVMKPANLHQEIKLLYGKQDKHLYSFIDYLMVQGTERTVHKGNLNFEILFETLAYKLRMEYLIKTRQFKRMNTQFMGYFEKAKALNYIAEFTIQEAKNPKNNKAIYSLNPDKIYRPEALKKAEA